MSLFFFFFNDTATTEIYTLSLHDALPISQFFDFDDHVIRSEKIRMPCRTALVHAYGQITLPGDDVGDLRPQRSEEHTSELQSQSNLVCRLLLEKKKKHEQQPRPALIIYTL